MSCSHADLVDGRCRDCGVELPERLVEFVTIEQFVATPVEQAEPLVVDTAGNTVMPAGGLGFFYGDGGAGKTTLGLDGTMHFAAGRPWLTGLATPTRALRIGWIENEGPQEEFRRKLERKLEAWRGRVPSGQVHVLRRPWASIDLRLEEHRAGVALGITELDLDLVFVGPLNRLGMEGGGTPDDVRAFVRLLEDVQARAGRKVALLVLHHENTRGQVSGAWVGVPDLLVHVVARGNGHTRVTWQKAKWSSTLHGTSTALVWSEHEGFALADEPPARPERTWDAIAEYVLANGGCAWNEVKENVEGEAKYLARRRDEMLADGLLLNAGRKSRFELWHRDDEARPTLDASGSGVRTGSEPTASPPDSLSEGVRVAERFAGSPRRENRQANRSAHAPSDPARTARDEGHA